MKYITFPAIGAAIGAAVYWLLFGFIYMKNQITDGSLAPYTNGELFENGGPLWALAALVGAVFGLIAAFNSADKS